MPEMPKPEYSTRSLINHPEIVAELRPYLGMSGLGHECARYLWYSFRWYYVDTFSRRTNRIFQRGHREEVEVYKELERIGYIVTASQDTVTDMAGHISGHCDGMVEGVVEAPKTKHLLEIKTANDKAFKDMVKNRVQKSKPTYYAQMQLYMHYFKLTRALFIMVNKNDDDWYIERVRYDKAYAEEKILRGKMIVLATKPPEQIAGPTFYACKWCSAYQVCHKGLTPAENCRTCEHSSPTNDGQWYCNSWDVDLSEEQQRAGCDQHKLMASLVS